MVVEGVGLCKSVWVVVTRLDSDCVQYRWYVINMGVGHHMQMCASVCLWKACILFSSAMFLFTTASSGNL